MPGSRDDTLTAMQSCYEALYTQFTPLRLIGGELRGPCPLHRGDGPNFVANPETGHWFCHSVGCGKPGGDVFDFVMIKDGCSFSEALAYVAAFAGVVEATGVPYRQPARIAPPAPCPVSVRFLDPAIAENLHRSLMNNDKFRCWLSDHRGFTTESLKRFQIGLMKDDTGHYRVTFPIYDRQGKLTNIRKHLFAYKPELTDQRRREMGKTLPWAKGLRADLYPLVALEGTEEALIVEGEADAVMACQMGFAAATGTSGASTWHPHWTEELRGLKRAIVLYDQDQAGQDGARKVAASLSLVVPDVRIAQYQGGRLEGPH